MSVVKPSDEGEVHPTAYLSGEALSFPERHSQMLLGGLGCKYDRWMDG